MIKGCYLDIANNTGIKTLEILLRHGYPPTIVQILVRFASTGWIGSDEISIQVPSSMNNTLLHKFFRLPDVCFVCNALLLSMIRFELRKIIVFVVQSSVFNREWRCDYENTRERWKFKFKNTVFFYVTPGNRYVLATIDCRFVCFKIHERWVPVCDYKWFDQIKDIHYCKVLKKLPIFKELKMSNISIH